MIKKFETNIIGNADDKVVNEFVEYELKIKAHNKCKNYDVIEAIEVNFDGILVI